MGGMVGWLLIKNKRRYLFTTEGTEALRCTEEEIGGGRKEKQGVKGEKSGG